MGINIYFPVIKIEKRVNLGKKAILKIIFHLLKIVIKNLKKSKIIVTPTGMTI